MFHNHGEGLSILMIFWTCIPISCLLMYLLWVNSCLACERSSGRFQPGEGLLRDCEIFAKIRCELYLYLLCQVGCAGDHQGGRCGPGRAAGQGDHRHHGQERLLQHGPFVTNPYHCDHYIIVLISGLLRVLPHYEDTDAILLGPWHGILSQGGASTTVWSNS